MVDISFNWIIPSKLAGHQAPSSEQDLRWLKERGILALVRMAEKHKAKVNAAQVKALKLIDCHEPVDDFTAPSQVQIDRMVSFIADSIVQGRPVGVSCRAGLGRTGTVLACYLARRNMLSATGAILEVRRVRPGSIETDAQIQAVEQYINGLSKKSAQGEVTPSEWTARFKNLAASVKFGRTCGHAHGVVTTALELHDRLLGGGIPLASKDGSRLLEAAGWVHDVGVAVGEPHNITGFKWLRQALSSWGDFQLSDDDRAVILCCVLWHRGQDFSAPKDFALARPEQTTFLAGVLRIADGLCFPDVRMIKRISISREGYNLVIEVCPLRKGDSLAGPLKHTNP